MKAEIRYLGQTAFETSIRDHKFMMDTQVAAGGENQGPSPKELLLAAIIGCSGMDVAALLKKHKMALESLTVHGDAEPRKVHPRVFSSVQVTFSATGTNISPEGLNDAVYQSLTKFCGVSAMVNNVSPINYVVFLNDKEIGRGSAKFDL